MQLTAKVKLIPTEAQADSLKRTLEKANAACNYISDVAWSERIFGKFQVQKLVYHDVRQSFDLAAQLTIRCIAKVTDAYRIDKKTKREFQPFGSIAFDDRILAWKLAKHEISIWTIDGRQAIPFLAHDRAKELLQGSRGESDLCLIDGEFYLFTSCEVDEPETKDVDDFLGVDVGIKNIASDSDGKQYSGSKVNSLRYRHARLRSKLQSKGTKSAKRLLKRRKRKEARFAKDVNHQISKQLVSRAQDTTPRRPPGIALEDLTAGAHWARDRVTVRKAQRRQKHSGDNRALGRFPICVPNLSTKLTCRESPSCWSIRVIPLKPAMFVAALIRRIALAKPHSFVCHADIPLTLTPTLP